MYKAHVLLKVYLAFSRKTKSPWQPDNPAGHDARSPRSPQSADDDDGCVWQREKLLNLS